MTNDETGVFKWKLVEVHTIRILVRVMHGECKCLVILKLNPPGGLTWYIKFIHQVAFHHFRHCMKIKFLTALMRAFSSFLNEAFLVLPLACVNSNDLTAAKNDGFKVFK